MDEKYKFNLIASKEREREREREIERERDLIQFALIECTATAAWQ